MMFSKLNVTKLELNRLNHGFQCCLLSNPWLGGNGTGFTSLGQGAAQWPAADPTSTAESRDLRRSRVAGRHDGSVDGNDGLFGWSNWAFCVQQKARK